MGRFRADNARYHLLSVYTDFLRQKKAPVQTSAIPDFKEAFFINKSNDHSDLIDMCIKKQCWFLFRMHADSADHIPKRVDISILCILAQL